MNITLSLAGIPVELALNYPDYLPYYKPYLTDAAPLGCVGVGADRAAPAPVDAEMEQNPIYLEHVELSMLVSDFLLHYDRVIFHGTAFVWNDLAWIVTAPPGTGKTTHFMLWKKLYGTEVSIINGDKPILAYSDRGLVVHPSPWNGKENMGRKVSAPLGGVILLERGSENRIDRVKKEAVFDIYKQFMYSAKDPAAVRTVFKIEDTMLRTVPVWRLYSRGDDASAMLCRETIERSMK